MPKALGRCWPTSPTPAARPARLDRSGRGRADAARGTGATVVPVPRLTSAPAVAGTDHRAGPWWSFNGPNVAREVAEASGGEQTQETFGLGRDRLAAGADVLAGVDERLVTRQGLA